MWVIDLGAVFWIVIAGIVAVICMLVVDRVGKQYGRIAIRPY